MTRKQPTVISASDDQGPGRAMPQTSDQHSQDQVVRRSHVAAPLAAEWDVYVVAQARRQGNVPTSPEVRRVACLVGRIKVLRNPQTEQIAQANGHAAVA